MKESQASIADLGALAIGLLGTWLLVSAVLDALQFAWLNYMNFSSESSGYLWAYVAVVSGMAALGWFLIGARVSLGHALAPRGEGPPLTLPFTEDGIASLGFALLGAYFVVLSLSDTAHYLAEFASARLIMGPVDSRAYLSSVSSVELWASRTATLAQLLIGACLFLRSRGVAKLWREARRAKPSA